MKTEQTKSPLRPVFAMMNAELDKIAEDLKKEPEINVPEGYEVVKIERGKYEVRKKENPLPKTWEEYCKNNSVAQDEFFIGETCNINKAAYHIRDFIKDRNLLATEEDAKAFLALMQLVRLRNCYNESIVGETDTEKGGSIVSAGGCPFVICNDSFVKHVLSFKTKELAQQFMDNFIDLIEKAKGLI